MKVIRDVASLREELARIKASGRAIGFVPTMGYLHRGHLSLLEAACQECSYTVMSIFVNPLQFGENEDYHKYPRDLTRDMKLAEKHGCDLLFAPDISEIYPRKPLTEVNVRHLSDRLCGLSRPGHFTGVATVVTIFFNLIQPERAYFGQKDAQQAIILKKMVADLHLPVLIKVLPTVREADGLALSSRNEYLSFEERKAATFIFKGLMAGQQLLEKGEREVKKILAAIQEVWQQEPLLEPEYLEVVEIENLSPLDWVDSQALVAAAVKVGGTRLIDNFLWPKGVLI